MLTSRLGSNIDPRLIYSNLIDVTKLPPQDILHNSRTNDFDKILAVEITINTFLLTQIELRSLQFDF